MALTTTLGEATGAACVQQKAGLKNLQKLRNPPGIHPKNCKFTVELAKNNLIDQQELIDDRRQIGMYPKVKGVMGIFVGLVVGVKTSEWGCLWAGQQWHVARMMVVHIGRKSVNSVNNVANPTIIHSESYHLAGFRNQIGCSTYSQRHVTRSEYLHQLSFKSSRISLKKSIGLPLAVVHP